MSINDNILLSNIQQFEIMKLFSMFYFSFYGSIHNFV